MSYSSYFLHFFQIWIWFGTEDVHEALLRYQEFSWKWRTEGHTNLGGGGGVNFYPQFPLSGVGRITYMYFIWPLRVFGGSVLTDHIRELVGSSNLKLVDAGNPFVGQPARHLCRPRGVWSHLWLVTTQRVWRSAGRIFCNIGVLTLQSAEMCNNGFCQFEGTCRGAVAGIARPTLPQPLRPSSTSIKVFPGCL